MPNLDIRVKDPDHDIKPPGGKIDVVFRAKSRPKSRVLATFTVRNGPYVFAPLGGESMTVKPEKEVSEGGRNVTTTLDLVRGEGSGVLRFEIGLRVEQLIGGGDSEELKRAFSITVSKDSKAPPPAPLKKAFVATAVAPVAAPVAAAPEAAAAVEAAPAPFPDLKKRRQKANLTQKTLHELSGVSVSTISRLERLGKETNCTAETRRKIEDALRRIEDALR